MMSTVPTWGGRRRRLVRVGAAEAGEVVLPLHGEERLLAGVTVLASGDDVTAHGSAAATERDDVIHAERRLADPTPAVVADAGSDPALPPLTGPQLAGPCALPLEQIGVDGGVELTHGPTAPRTALPIHASARRPGPPRFSAPWPPCARGRRPCTGRDR